MLHFLLNQLLNGVENYFKTLIVLALQLPDFQCKVLIRFHQSAQGYKGAHDSNVGFNGTRAIEDATEHGHALFGKGEGWVLGMLSTAIL